MTVYAVIEHHSRQTRLSEIFAAREAADAFVQKAERESAGSDAEPLYWSIHTRRLYDVREPEPDEEISQ